MSDPDKKQAKARLKELEILTAEIELEEKELNLDMLRISHNAKHISHGPSQDIGRGIFRLESGVYDEVLSLASVIERWAAQNPGEKVRLYIFSPGGSVFHGFALYDTLRTLSEAGHEVTTVIRGFAGSMASVIFLAGDVRLIGAESYIHQHEGSSGVVGSTSAIREEAEFMKRLGEKVARIYATRTSLTAAQFKAKIRKKEWYAESDEAVRLGIATAVG